MKRILFTIILSTIMVGAAISKDYTIPLIGAKAPSFTANSTNGEITFPDNYGKNWKILFSHPRDFTPVCSSELLELAYSEKDFEKMGVKVAIVSTDVISQHKMWKAHLEELDYKNRGPQQINFPIIDDSKHTISKQYGMLHEPTSTTEDVRGVFIIDSNNIVRSINFYPMSVGRNIDEIKRIVAALQTTDEAKVLTPANWNNGDDVLVPYYPYTQEQLSENPIMGEEYYNVGNRMWFKKVENLNDKN
ncbi:peroxiredoxin [Sunxiuqinia sp. A32]|uniref:peroxiredoxin n=1 Tax=Sunxiuqinia sp. A32 TaxID=3461496 RepID=UPI0040466C21